MLIIHANLGKTEIIHNVDTTRYVATFGCFQTATSAGQLFKNHVIQNDANSIVYNIFAVIPMCVLHDFFDKLPIARGLSVRLNLYLNTGIQITETVAASNHIAITSSVIPRALCPFQVSPISNDPTTGSGFSVSTAVTLRYALRIGNSTLQNCAAPIQIAHAVQQAFGLQVGGGIRKDLLGVSEELSDTVICNFRLELLKLFCTLPKTKLLPNRTECKSYYISVVLHTYVLIITRVILFFLHLVQRTNFMTCFACMYFFS